MSRRNPRLKYRTRPDPQKQFIKSVFGGGPEKQDESEPINTTTSVFYGKKASICPRSDSLFTNRTLRPFSHRNNWHSESYTSPNISVSAPETARQSLANDLNHQIRVK